MGIPLVRSLIAPLPCLSLFLGNHVESIQFLHSPMAPLVLGRLWLDMYDPHISWPSGRILGWSEACHANCLRSAPSPSSGTKPSLSPPVLTGVPPVYHDLVPVFSKESALSLPDYTTCLSPRRRRCAITLQNPWPQASYSRPPPQ